MIQCLSEQFAKSTKESNFLKQALEGEYPKLLRLFNDLWRRLASSCGEMTYEELEKISSPFLNRNKEEERLRESLKDFEQAYLSRSLSRLFDPVNLMFSSGETPTDLEVKQVSRVLIFLYSLLYYSPLSFNFVYGLSLKKNLRSLKMSYVKLVP